MPHHSTSALTAHRCGRLGALLLLCGLLWPLESSGQGRDGAFVDERLGQAVYRIPLILPPGTAGTGPALALVYRSGNGKGGSGSLGLDWHLEGLSAIERDTKFGVPYNYAAGKTCTGSEPMYCYLPRFVLDGQDLQCDVADCSSGRYRTQQDDGRLIQYDSQNNHWEIRDREGRTLYFGNGTWNAPRDDGEIVNLRNGQVFSWLLTRIVDAHGNWIDFEYQQASPGVAYPEEIRWAQAGVAANRKVVFSLDTAPPRPDRKIDYRGGFRRETSRRVETIEVQAAQGARVTKYVLSYAQDPQNNRSMLVAVQRFGADGSTSLPAWTFDYTVGSQGTGTRPDGTVGAVDYSSPDIIIIFGADPFYGYIQEVFADVNRDGLTDIHQVYTTGNGNWTPTHAYLNDGTQFLQAESPWSTSVVPGLMPGAQPAYYTCSVGGDCVSLFRLMDLTGDGYPDGHRYQPPGSQTGQLMLGGAAGFLATPVQLTETRMRALIRGIGSIYSAYQPPGKLFEVELDYLDMNGDGLPDRVWAGDGFPDLPPGSDNGNWQVYPNQGLTGSQLSFGLITWPSPNNEPIEFGYPLSPVEWTMSRVLDFNADGLPDRLVVRPNASTPLAVYYNDGAGFAPLEGVGSPSIANIAAAAQPYAHTDVRTTNAGFTLEDYVDLNGDGFPDWVNWASTLLANPPQWAGCSKDWSHWLVEFGTGSGQTGVALPWEHHDCSAEWPASVHAAWAFFLQDLNGDGLLDYVKNKLNQVWLNDGPIPGLLMNVREPAGGEVEFQYATSAQMTDEGSPANPGLGEIIVVATEIARSDGRGSPVIGDQYHYAKGRYDYEEHEFRGFGVVTRTPLEANPVPGAAEFITTYATDRACAGTVLESKARLAASGALLLHTWTNVQIVEGPSSTPAPPQENRFAACLPREQVETHFETAGAGAERLTYTRRDYDANYNPVQVHEWGEIQNTLVLLPHEDPSAPRTFAGGLPIADIGEDERTTCTKYVTNLSGTHLVSSVSERWIRTVADCSEPTTLDDPSVLARTQLYYDNLTLGSVVKGLVTKEERLKRDLGAAPPVVGHWIFSTVGYDDFGNPTLLIDPSTADDPNGRQVTIEYDAEYRTFVTKRKVGSDTAAPLTTSFTYGVCSGPPGLGLVCQEQPPGDAAANAPTAFGYDSFGRMTLRWNRNGLVESFCYAFEGQAFCGAVPAAGEILVRRQILAGGPSLSWRAWGDGLGRTFRTESPGKAGETVVVERSFDDRGRLATETLPRFSGVSSPLVRSFTYDVFDRPASIVDPDGSTVHLYSYEPWSEVVDVHFGLPALPSNRKSRELRRVDGLGRLVQVDQYRDAATPTVPYTLRAGYDALDQLRTVTDPIGVDAPTLCSPAHNVPSGAPCAGQDHVTSLDYDTLGHRVRIDDMDSGLWKFDYDNAGNLKKRTDAAGRHVRYRYDAYGRPWFAEEKSNGQTITGGFTYGTSPAATGYGELRTVSWPQASYTYTRDAAGRVVTLEQSLYGGFRFFTNFAYDGLDRLTSKTFPDSEQYNYGYSGLRLTSIGGATSVLDGASYDALGRPTNLDLGVTQIDREYGGPGARLSRIMMGNGASLDLNLGLDGLGRLASMHVEDGWGGGRDLGERTFDYDGMGRLKLATGPWEQPQGDPNAVSWEYRYDPLGNLREQVRQGGSQAGPGTAHLWTYAHATRSRFLTQFQRRSGGVLQATDTMAADAAGNPATINSATLVWNGQARMTRSTANTLHSYDVFGSKVVEDVPGAALYLHVADDFIYNIDDGMANKFFRVNGTLIATRATFYAAPYYSENPLVRWVVDPVRPLPGPALLLILAAGSAGLLVTVVRRRPPLWARASGSALVTVAFVLLPYNLALAVTVEEQTGPLPNGYHGDDLLFYGVDHLGSPRVVLDESGAVIEARDYAPFGDSIAHVGDYNLRHRFTAKPYIEVDQLYDYGARHYNPRWGRFISPDEAVEGFDAQGMHPYAYVRNRPTFHTDPTGYGLAEVDAVPGQPPGPSASEWAPTQHSILSAQLGNFVVQANDQVRAGAGAAPPVGLTAAEVHYAEVMTQNDSISSSMLGPELLIPGAGLGLRGLAGAISSTFRAVGRGIARAVTPRATTAAARGAARFADSKFAAQLERQLAKDGSGSVFKSLRSLEQRLAEHQAKLPELQFKSSVEREIRTFQNQIDTLKEFISQKGLTP